METKKALVLSGGSIKGAFQAGAVNAFIEKGYKFDSVYGISVGSLNGTFISHEAGLQNVSKDLIDWPLIGNNLVKFWTDNIKKPKDVVLKRNKLETLGSAIFNNFNGLVDTKPIQTLVRSKIKLENLQKSPVKLTVGAVNIADGEIVYANPSFPDFVDYVLASTAIPIVMPVVPIGGNKNQPFLDGGMRDVAPLKQAIQAGAEEIVCITCQARSLGGVTFDYGNLISLADRVMDIVVNEIVNNDIEWAEYFNDFLPADGTAETVGPLAGYRKIKLTVVRPPRPINLDLENFTSDDIKETIVSGYQTAMEQIK